MKASHVDPKVNNQFVEWCESKDENYGSVTVKRGKIHTHLGMKLDHTEKVKFMVDMRDCIKNMIHEHPTPIKFDEVPLNYSLYKVDKDSPFISPEEAELFHMFEMK